MNQLLPASDAYFLMHDGMKAFARMEANGIRVDETYLDRSIASTDAEAAGLQKKMRADPVYVEWRKAFGDRAKVTSPEQLTKLLFERLKVPYPLDPDGLGPGENPDAYTDTGRYISKDYVLDAVDMPFVRDWQRHKKLIKLSSTFLKGLKRETIGGFLHPYFNLHTVRTYRSSSGSDKTELGGGKDYNFQNLPVRNPEFAKTIRSCFVPRKGRRLVENDFSAMEFVGAACFWSDPAMREYASDPAKDIHRDCAAKLFKCPREEVSKKTMRYSAKNNFVFPELYGSYWKQIAPNIWKQLDALGAKTESGVPVKKWLKRQGIGGLDQFARHVEKVEQWFMNLFAAFAAGKEKAYQEYRRRGCFRTPTGFVCSGLYSKNDVLNYPVQGMCFHWCLATIIRMQRLIEKRGMRSLLVGQIHDCIVADVPESELQDYLGMIKRTVAVHLSKKWSWITVPLRIEAEVTPPAGEGSWFDKKEWKDKDGVWRAAA